VPCCKVNTSGKVKVNTDGAVLNEKKLEADGKPVEECFCSGRHARTEGWTGQKHIATSGNMERGCT